MKIVRSVTTALALFAVAACGDVTPSAPAEQEMTQARFLELQASAIRIAERVQETGIITAADQAEIDALERELDACVGVETGQGAATELASATTGVYPGPCLPCPFIISQGNCIGVLRSEGPCRPGAGLERCFYNWYCYGTNTIA
jgi:hypothetical protein